MSFLHDNWPEMVWSFLFLRVLWVESPLIAWNFLRLFFIFFLFLTRVGDLNLGILFMNLYSFWSVVHATRPNQ